MYPSISFNLSIQCEEYKIAKNRLSLMKSEFSTIITKLSAQRYLVIQAENETER